MIKTLEVIEAKSIEANEKMNCDADYAFFELSLMDWDTNVKIKKI